MTQSAPPPAKNAGDPSTGDPSTGEPVRRLGFIPAFDGLRGVAVLLVVAVHFRRLVDPWTTEWVFRPAVARLFTKEGNTANSGWLLIDRPHPSLFAQLVPKGGFLGVDIFFVLSGFLITSLLLSEQWRKGRIRFVAFYRRRALRLLPALLVFAAVHLIYANSVHISPSLEHRSIISVVFYYFNWQQLATFPAVPRALSHLWSLSIEEQFYFVWPLTTMFLLGIRRKLSTVVGVLCGSILVIAVWRAILAGHINPGLVYSRTDTRADSLLVGALAAHLWIRGAVPAKRYLKPAAWASLAFLVICIYTLLTTSLFLYNGGFTAIAFAVAIILLAVLETDWRPTRVLRLRPLRAVGRVSYGLYVWHLLAFSFVAGHLGRNPPAAWRITASLGAAAVVTLASWYLVERPFLRLKDRLEARDAERARSPGAAELTARGERQ